MNDSNLIYWYWLRSIKNVGPFRIKSLLDNLGSPQNIFEATLDEYRETPNIGPGLAKSIQESKPEFQNVEDFFDKEVRISERLNINIITLFDPIYPKVLREQEAVSPPILYVKGTLENLSNKIIAVVGTRKASNEALRLSRRFASDAVAEGWQIASGLALGIDTASHSGAIENGGFTYAVLGSGLDKIYPTENIDLAMRIIESGGAIISEYPFGTPPKGDNLRKRNKIIVGLSQAVAIPECPLGSGTLIAAEEAFKQVKPVFAFQFSPPTNLSKGSRKLINDGDAMLIDQGKWNDQIESDIVGFQKTKVAVIFDLDGVLVNTKPVTRNALKQTVREVCGSIPPKTEIDKVVNLSPRRALQELCPGNIEEMLKIFNHIWTDLYGKYLKSDQNIHNMLDKLNKINSPMAVVTSRNMTQTQNALIKSEIDGYFLSLVTWGKTPLHKPNPQPILFALAEIHEYAGAIYVGDQEDDIYAAQDAGLEAVLAIWFLSEDEKERSKNYKANKIVNKPSDLYDIVLRLKRKSWAKGFK